MLNRRIQPDQHWTEIFHPYPGTELYESCRQMGLPVDATRVVGERRRAPLDLPGFSASQINRRYRWFDFRVRLGHVPLRQLVQSEIFRTFPLIGKAYYELAVPVLGRLRRRFSRPGG
jgi:hypothetical protein